MPRALQPTLAGDDDFRQRPTAPVAEAKNESGVRARLVTRRDLPAAHADSERVARRPTRELPALDAVPRRLVEWDALREHNLSREKIYILTLVDGCSTLEDVIDASALSPLAAHDALEGLLRAEIVGLS
jgi:hypothetical protein